MDFSGSETYDDINDAGEGVKTGCFGRLLRFLLVVVCIVFLGIGLVAYFLTTDLGRIWLLNKINRTIAPAQLTVKEWDAGFFGRFTLYGVEYYSPDDGLRVEIEDVVLEKGVFALIPIGKLALGDVNLNSPSVTYDYFEAAENREKNERKKGSSTDESSVFFLPVVDLGGALRVNKGTVYIKEKGRTLFKGDSVEGRLIVDSFWKPFGFEIKGVAGGGSVGLTGDLQSINSLINGGDSDYTDKVVLQLGKVDLSAFPAIFKLVKSPVLPHAGIAEGALTLERSGDAGYLKAEGGLLIEKMQLVTGDNEFSPAGDVALLVDSEIKDDLCQFRKFEFSSPWGKIKLHGTVRQVDGPRRFSGDVDVDIDLDVAAVTRDFRYVLPIDDELKISKGRLTGFLKMQNASDGVRIDTSLKTSNLAMLFKKTPVSISRDPSLVLKIFFPGNALPEVEELRIRGSFADIYGKGNVRQGALKGYVDLSQFSKDFKGLLKNGVVLGGAAHFNLSTRPSGDDVSFDFITKFSRFNITSSHVGATSVEEGSLIFKGSAAGAAEAKRIADISLYDADYDLRINQSRLHGSVKRFVPVQDGAELPVLRGFSLSADMEIADIVKACGVLVKREDYIAALGWKGSFLMNAAAEVANNVAKLRINGAGRDIAFKIAGQSLSEPDLRFGGAASFDAAQDTLTLSEIDITSGFADVKIPEWVIGFSGNREYLKFNGTADAKLNMGVVYPLFGAGKKKYDQVRGDLKLGLKAVGDGSGTDLNINGALTDFYILADKEIRFYEKKAELHSSLAFKKNGCDAVVKSLNFYSSIIDISAKGDIQDFWHKRIADLNGDLDLKFDTVSRLLRVRGMDEWEFTGHRKSPFELKGTLSDAFMQNGFFSGSAYLASLNGLGLSAGGAVMSLDLKDGNLKCDWQPALNGGKLKLSPVFEFSSRGTGLLLPDNLQMLDKVKITQDMVDKLLVNFNPMFAGSRIHRGTVSVKVNNFSSGPRPGHGDLNGSFDFVFEDLSMTLSPSMCNLLSMINVKSSSYQVKNLPMRVSVRNERIYLDPMTMVFSRQPVVVSGSVGFDSTINYLIEIPLGESIARKTGLSLPKGLTVKVPVTGTVDNPRLDTGALEKTFGGFIKNTLGDEALKGVTDFLEQLKKELR